MPRASRSRRAVRSDTSSSSATSAAVTWPLAWSSRRMATRRSARTCPSSQRKPATGWPVLAGRRPVLTPSRCRPDGVKLTLDLHDIYNRGGQIDSALRAVMDEAERTKARTVEIIPGKGSGQLKKRVLRFLDQPEVKARYHRVEKDSHNYGRVLVHFRWK